MNVKPNPSVNELVDHLFRHNAGQMVSVLTRIFGFENIDVIEDAIQEAMIKALNHWPFKGIPKNPTAWLIQVAKNRVLDQFRRNKRVDPGGGETLEKLDRLSGKLIEDKFRYPREMKEDLLCMMFATCDPALKPDSQIALTLKTVGGFSVSEIAAAFLSKNEATAKMLTRAKKTLKEKKMSLEIPPPDELEPRLNAVMKVLYLMFNEGYSASSGAEVVRTDICFEAIRLAQILSDHPVTRSPKVEALLALFFFQGARLGARNSQTRDVLLLADQQRELWDKKMINVGLYHFRRSAVGVEVTDYHLEAEIASCHILANDFDSTDWDRMLQCYDLLLNRRFSPVVAINRIIVISKVKGAEAALNELKNVEKTGLLESYLPYHIACAQLEFETGALEKAAESYRRAIQLATNRPTLRFLERKLEALLQNQEQ
ncbi:MAG: sigma-70 family RNA polymerase sigma factor [Pyrinomonadaceae bacterium]|nr:sigma-70 family RNA polymerase sigma factor [Pyrinomonadaceae bacterium]